MTNPKKRRIYKYTNVSYFIICSNLQEDPEPLLNIIAPQHLRIFQRGGPQGLSHGDISPLSLGIGSAVVGGGGCRLRRKKGDSFVHATGESLVATLGF